jgi:Family of unknown function (DUF6527)
MSRSSVVTYVFVDSTPETLQPETMYISTKYRAIVHLCLCGCGEKVLLNLDPEGWSVTFDGLSISIHDSIGNVGLPCRSHYIVRKNRVTWLPPLLNIDPKAALELGLDERRREVSRPGWFARWFRPHHRTSKRG